MPLKRMVLKNTILWESLCPLASDPSCQLDVLWHDGDSLGVDGAQVGVFEQTHQVGFSGFLKCGDGRSLEPEVGLEVLSDLTNQTLERQLSDQEFGALLIPSD